MKVTASHSVRWPPHEPSIIGGEPNDLRLDATYRLPRDSAKQIGIRASFSIFNDGPRTVVIGASDGWTEIVPTVGPQKRKAGAHEIPGETIVKGYFDVVRSVSDWVEIA